MHLVRAEKSAIGRTLEPGLLTKKKVPQKRGTFVSGTGSMILALRRDVITLSLSESEAGILLRYPWRALGTGKDLLNWEIEVGGEKYSSISILRDSRLGSSLRGWNLIDMSEVGDGDSDVVASEGLDSESTSSGSLPC
ncbi:hypothetical protein BpHYR1_007772 [Brachionus plicatilis]|uniref:Uncharacterized protein n=1 Tax=Brachionus plicatilis TaxID=10195 RepID=A0A3M7SYV3_BRAPC|nr:hypothetical protein BpHYR1_007772 [Brachionus plicatilis]